MGSKIQIRRGLKANLPTLDVGELGYCTDTEELFIGTTEGNDLLTFDQTQADYAKSQGDYAKGEADRLAGMDVSILDNRMTAAESGLAENTQQLSDRRKWTSNKRKAYITIIDDDGKADFMTKLKPVFDAHNVKPSVAINAQFIGQPGYMTWAQIEQLKAEGYEILNHGFVGAEAKNLTLAQLQANYEQEKSMFLAHGLDTFDYFVYSGMQPVEDSDLKNKLKQVYKCCFANTQSKDNYIPFDNYEIRRTAAFYGSVTNTQIDLMIEKSGWCVLFGHSYTPEYTAAALESTLTYIESKGLQIEYIQAKDMIDKFTNQYELVNTDGDYFRLDGNGHVDFSFKGKTLDALLDDISTFDTTLKLADGYFTDVPITSYLNKSITIAPVDYTMAQSLGLPDAGVITTVRWYDATISSFNFFSYQEYNKVNNSDRWIRKWNQTLNRWELFVPISTPALQSTKRPRYAYIGTSVFDTTLGKPIWANKQGATENVTLTRSTAYKKWDVMVVGTAMFLCTVAGTTGVSEPSWNYTTNSLTVDGTVTWQYIGQRVTWVDSSGAVV